MARLTRRLTSYCAPRRRYATTTFSLLLLDDHESLARLQTVFPTGVIARQILHEPEPYPFAAIFRVPAGAEAEIDATRVRVRFSDLITLVAYRYEMADDALDVTLYWQSLAPASVDYTVFVHLYADDQRLVGQHDGQPCAGTYPTTRWQAGEIVVDHHRIALPTEQDTSHCKLCVGLYNLSTLERLPIAEADVPFADQCACIAMVVPGRP
jgi:hypothetical protein